MILDRADKGFVSIAPPTTGTQCVTFHSTSAASKTCLSMRPEANSPLSFNKWRVYLLRWRDAVVRFIRQHSFASGVDSIFSSYSSNRFAGATQPEGNYFNSNAPVILSSVKTQVHSSCSHAQSQLQQRRCLYTVFIAEHAKYYISIIGSSLFGVGG